MGFKARFGNVFSVRRRFVQALAAREFGEQMHPDRDDRERAEPAECGGRHRAEQRRGQPGLELAENIMPGLPLTSRSVRLRAIVHRGKLADAVINDGTLTLSVKVEVLEDGLPGQTIRVRNLKSKKEFRGKVHNEETIHVTL